MTERTRETTRFDIRKHLDCDASTLVFLSGAYMLSGALFSAVELGVFDLLQDRPRTEAELAREIGVPAGALERLTGVMQALGLVERDEAGNLRNRSLSSQMLTRSGPASLRSFMLHQQRHGYPLFGHVTEAVRTGRPQTSRWGFGGAEDGEGYAQLFAQREELRLFLEAMDTAATGVGTNIAERVDFTGVHSLIDLGGGRGQIAVELVRSIPHLQVTIVDHEAACAVAKENLAHSDVEGRVTTFAADFLGAVPPDLPPADAVLLGGVLADWNDEERRRLLAFAHACLRPGGRLLASETLLDEDRSGPLLPALLSLSMLVAMRGENFTASQLKSLVAAAGFEDAQVYDNRDRGVRDLVVARRP